MELEGLITPTWLTFKDITGREWKALALIAPLRSEYMDPMQIAVAEDLDLKVSKIDVIKG